MKHYALIIIILLYASCDRPRCEIRNEIFKTHQPQDAVYQQELARVIERNGKDAFSYWIAGYDEHNGRQYMLANIQSDSVCAIAVLDITDVERLEQFKSVKAVSYVGAGLSNLEYEIVNTDSGMRFVYKDVGWIID